MFLALSLTAMLSLILGMAEAARIRVIRARTECVTDTAVCSVLSEFSRELFEQYDLLFVDTGYGGAGSEEHVRQRLEYYLRSAPCLVLGTEFGTSVVVTLMVKSHETEGLLDQIRRISEGQAELMYDHSEYLPWLWSETEA